MKIDQLSTNCIADNVNLNKTINTEDLPIETQDSASEEINISIQAKSFESFDIKTLLIQWSLSLNIKKCINIPATHSKTRPVS